MLKLDAWDRRNMFFKLKPHYIKMIYLELNEGGLNSELVFKSQT